MRVKSRKPPAANFITSDSRHFGLEMRGGADDVVGDQVRHVAGDGEHHVVVLGVHHLDIRAEPLPERASPARPPPGRCPPAASGCVQRPCEKLGEARFRA